MKISAAATEAARRFDPDLPPLAMRALARSFDRFGSDRAKRAAEYVTERTTAFVENAAEVVAEAVRTAMQS